MIDALATIKPGESVVYYIGELGRDRIWGENQERMKNVNAVAGLAKRMSDEGIIYLTQRKVGYQKFEYIATKRVEI